MVVYYSEAGLGACFASFVRMWCGGWVGGWVR